MLPMLPMLQTVSTWIFASLVVLAVDLPWLYLQSKNSERIVKNISGSFELRPWTSIPVYMALSYIILNQKSILASGLMGIAVYAVYDFTTLFLFKEYPLWFALADTLWGGVLFSVCYYLFTKVLHIKFPGPM